MEYIHQTYRVIPTTSEHNLPVTLNSCPFVSAWNYDYDERAELEIFTIYFYAPLRFIDSFIENARRLGVTANRVVEGAIND